ncbi:MAG: vWA domain-containing protein, partial [Phycisphaerales bacterium]
MNHGLIRWLLDLDVIPPDARGVRLVWEHAWPGWVWVVLLLGAALLSAWSYTRLLGPARGRAVLAVTRTLLVVLILLMISGPMLQQPRETVEQDWVLVLVDRSASMNISDVQAPPSSAQSGRLSRDDQLRSLLHEHAQMWQQLAETRHVLWLGFHEATFNLPTTSPASRADDLAAPVDLGEPSGRRTRLNAALEQALQRAAARAVSGVVLLSDGRTTDPPTRAIISRLRSDKISVFAVGLGSSEPFGDLAIRSVEAPQRAFIRDEVPVLVELDQLGSAGGGAPAVVRLIDETTGQELDRVELPDWGDSLDRPRQVTMTARPLLAGEATWKVVVQSDQPDLVSENHARTFRIELIDRPLRVLFVDGYPR